MPSLVLNYNVADVYQVMADLFYNFWPLVAAFIGMMFATMLFSALVGIFSRWIEDRRG